MASELDINRCSPNQDFSKTIGRHIQPFLVHENLTITEMNRNRTDEYSKINLEFPVRQ